MRADGGRGQDLRPRIFALAGERGWKLRELSRLRYSLEDIYIRLTRPQSEEEKFLMQAYLTLTRRELAGILLFVDWLHRHCRGGLPDGLELCHAAGQTSGRVPTRCRSRNFSCTRIFWLILLFSAPVITMRLFALEKSSGTFETLMTAPVSDLAVVLAKFSAALVLFLDHVAAAAGFILILVMSPTTPTWWMPGTLAATFLGLFLMGTLYMSLGCFASSLTSNQIVAAMITFAIGLGLFILSFGRTSWRWKRPGWRRR